MAWQDKFKEKMGIDKWQKPPVLRDVEAGFTRIGRGALQTMSSIAEPIAAGTEYLTGAPKEYTRGVLGIPSNIPQINSVSGGGSAIPTVLNNKYTPGQMVGGLSTGGSIETGSPERYGSPIGKAMPSIAEGLTPTETLNPEATGRVAPSEYAGTITTGAGRGYDVAKSPLSDEENLALYKQRGEDYTRVLDESIAGADRRIAGENLAHTQKLIESEQDKLSKRAGEIGKEMSNEVFVRNMSPERKKALMAEMAGINQARGSIADSLTKLPEEASKAATAGIGLSLKAKVLPSELAKTQAQTEEFLSQSGLNKAQADVFKDKIASNPYFGHVMSAATEEIQDAEGNKSKKFNPDIYNQLAPHFGLPTLPSQTNKQYSQADIEHTAKKYGITIDEVKKRLGVS